MYQSNAKQRKAKLEEYIDNFNILEKTLLRVTYYDPTLEDFRTRVLWRFAKKLYMTTNVNPDLISIVGCVCAVTAAFLLQNDFLCSFLILLSLVCDCCDGVIARVNAHDIGDRYIDGGIVDVICDTIGTMSLIIGLVYYGYIVPWLGYTVLTLLVPYVLTSSLKNKKFMGQFIAYGIRIMFGLGLVVCFVLRIFNTLPVHIFKDILQFQFIIMAVLLLIGIFHPLQKTVKIIFCNSSLKLFHKKL